MIYLDNAASSPILPEVIAEMTPLMQSCYGNPSSIHEQGRKARVVIEESRSKIAGLLHVSPSEIAFTSGGTEAINWAIDMALEAHDIKQIISVKTEHPAVLKPIERALAGHKAQAAFLTPDKQGHIDINALEQQLAKADKALVCLMHANNETGTLLPLKEIALLCKQYKAFFLCDMVQTIGKFHIDLGQLPISFATASAHKFHGPKGIGFLYINAENPLSPALLGGAQERNRRAGTENLYGIAGMAKALEIAMSELTKNMAGISQLKKQLAEGLAAIEGVSFNADSDKQGLYTLLNVAFPNIPQTDMLVQKLDMAGIAVSGGSACSSGSVKPSRVLEEIQADTSKTSIRFSFSKFNTFDDINTVVNTINEILRR